MTELTKLSKRILLQCQKSETVALYSNYLQKRHPSSGLLRLSLAPFYYRRFFSSTAVTLLFTIHLSHIVEYRKYLGKCSLKSRFTTAAIAFGGGRWHPGLPRNPCKVAASH